MKCLDAKKAEQLVKAYQELYVAHIYMDIQIDRVFIQRTKQFYNGVQKSIYNQAPFGVPSICHPFLFRVETVKFDRFGGDTFHHNPTASLQDLKSRNVRVSAIRPLASKTAWGYFQATSFCLVETGLYQAQFLYIHIQLLENHVNIPLLGGGTSINPDSNSFMSLREAIMPASMASERQHISKPKSLEGP